MPASLRDGLSTMTFISGQAVSVFGMETEGYEP